jgi:hypothetical protein
LHRHLVEVALCALDDPGLGLDLDQPEDYAQASLRW